jgi:hypothetical protein
MRTMTDEVPVDLVVNTFERTYREVLSPGFFEGLEDQNRRSFARKLALINNVHDRDDAVAMAQALLDRGEIDQFEMVSEHLDRALAVTGLTRDELEPLLHWSDCVLVAATLQGSPWMLYWDAQTRLVEPGDWVGPAIELMDRDGRVLTASPSWERPGDDGRRPGLEKETLEWVNGFSIGRGFSDQLFLVRRSELAAPIYRQRCLAQVRYPTAHKAAIVESRIDAYMRHHGRLRAIASDATYVTEEEQGHSSYRPESIGEGLRWARNAVLRNTLRRSRWRPECCTHAWF